MSLMDHALAVAGLRNLSPVEIKPWFTVTKVGWRGCMADVRREEDVGDVVRHEMKKLNDGWHHGVVVRWDRLGERWEPLTHFRLVGDELEVWH